MLASGWRSNPPPASPLQCFSDSVGIPLNRKHHSTVQSSLSVSSIFFHPVYSPAAPWTLTTPLCPNPHHCVWWDSQQVHLQCHQPTMLFVSASVIVVLIWIFIPLESVSIRPPEAFTEDSASQGVKLDFYVSETEVWNCVAAAWSVFLCKDGARRKWKERDNAQADQLLTKSSISWVIRTRQGTILTSLTEATFNMKYVKFGHSDLGGLNPDSS